MNSLDITGSIITVQYDMLIGGDVMLATKSGNLSPFSSEIEELIGRIPYSIVNLETVLYRNGQSLEKAVILRSDPTMAEYLHKVGVKAVTIANNHIMDFGIDGFKNTCEALEANRIAYCGDVGEGSQKPCIFETGGECVGILGYSFFSTKRNEMLTAREDILRLKSEGIKWTIIHLHWGEEYVAYPSPEQQRVARHLIDAGADVIVGHHPHVVQGIEKYKNGVIFYSLGNFNFVTSSIMPRFSACDRWGLMILLRFACLAPVDYLCIPVVINDEYQPCLPSSNDRKAFLAYLEHISKPLSERIDRLFWVRQAALPHFCNHLPSFARRIRRYGVRHFYQMIRWLISPSNYGFYLGLILHLIESAFGKAISIRCPEPSDDL